MVKIGASKNAERSNGFALLRPLIYLAVYAVGYFHGQVNSSASFFSTEDDETTKSLEEKARGFILPFERTERKEFIAGNFTDAYTFFHHYLHLFHRESPESPKDFELPMLHIWPNYFEAYHNHWQRYRGKNVVFMEIGVQSGGKIPLLRDYFGPGFTYVGVDINANTMMFQNADWIHIEIGDSGDPAFLRQLKNKYPKVDIFLDDGGHTMSQQRTAFVEMFPHVQPDGVYACEDLSTSWSEKFGGAEFQDYRNETFRENTMVGLVHRTMDMLNAGWIPGKVMKYELDDERMGEFWPSEPWWKEFATTVKHIHYYNQLVVYEKGPLLHNPFATMTVGMRIPFQQDNVVRNPVDWSIVQRRVANFTKSKWGF